MILVKEVTWKYDLQYSLGQSLKSYYFHSNQNHVVQGLHRKVGNMQQMWLRKKDCGTVYEELGRISTWPLISAL
jgi:hypothetical protein